MRLKTPRLETFIKIANALETSADILLKDVLIKGNEIRTSTIWQNISSLPSNEQDKILSVLKVMIENAIK